MNEYTIERVKKENEEDSLRFFLEAYESITGESFERVEKSERPDFLCIRQDGSKVGIELSRIRRGHPNDILFDKIVKKQDYMSIDYALDMIRRRLIEKEKKRNDPDWALPSATILLFELTDIPLSEIKNYINSGMLPDLYETGFAEIWLVDLTGLEAYDNVELFCVCPKEWEGYYPRGLQKPYG